ncbi:glutathione S-transferase T3-like [Henckelia pumila]|uniref:glutathione S-transferase T3-like n=1 Tax=Henckelia pumila TaxID=405737 RepID=UPI003C6DC2BE
MDPQSDDIFFSQLLENRDANFLNDIVTVTPNPQNTTEGTSKKTQRGVNFTRDEDIILVSGWLSTSLDAIVGNDKKSTTFWSRVHQYYHECKKPNFQERTVHSLTNRWSIIQRSVNKFCACLAQMESLHQSGHNENDNIRLAKTSYKENESHEFIFDHCWEILRFQPKWILQKEEVKGEKKNLCFSF